MRASSIRPALLGLALVAFAGVAHTAAEGSKAAYEQAIRSSDAEYKVARTRCDAHTDKRNHLKDICVEEAKAQQKRARALATFQRDGTVEAEKNARDAYAEADYAVAKAKCERVSGDQADLCVKEAKAVRDTAKNQADFRQKVLEARQDAIEKQQKTGYQLALEKCGQLSGNAEDVCKAKARADYQP